MMNFWTPTFEPWNKGFNAKDMPWYLLFDYVETYNYNHETGGFDFNWKDDFDVFDSHKWQKSDNTTFNFNNTTFRASQSYVEKGKLVLKMEPDDKHDKHYDQEHHTHVIPVRGEPIHEEDQHDIAYHRHWRGYPHGGHHG